jgi:hypothetical protein
VGERDREKYIDVYIHQQHHQHLSTIFDSFLLLDAPLEACIAPH